MSDDKPGESRPDDETQPVRPGGGATLPSAPAAAPGSESPAGAEPAAAATGPRGFRGRLGTLRSSDGGSRTFGLAALIASALAGIIVGGLGAAAIHAVGDDHDGDRGRMMQRRDTGGGEGFGGPGGMHGGPRGVPGQLHPTTVPDDEDSAG